MIKLIILDVDGVMTDGKKYYDRDGNVMMKNFCDKDWTAVKRFQRLGFLLYFLQVIPLMRKFLVIEIFPMLSIVVQDFIETKKLFGRDS